ncbi:MAG TPA: hypothetical protein VII56_07060 [Rhizomicrobium sp.]
MKIQLHETLNSIGALIGIALSIYVAVNLDIQQDKEDAREAKREAREYKRDQENRVRERESLAIDSLLVNENAVPTKVCEIGTDGCHREIVPRWRLIISNLSSEATAVRKIELTFIYRRYGDARVASYNATFSIGPSEVTEGRLPLNISAHSAEALTISHPIAVSAIDLAAEKCANNPHRRFFGPDCDGAFATVRAKVTTVAYKSFEVDLKYPSEPWIKDRSTIYFEAGAPPMVDLPRGRTQILPR